VRSAGRCALVAVAAALAFAAPASAGDFAGMYNDDAFFGSGSYRTSVFGAEAATGVELIRQPFDWKRIEIAPGDYDFRDYDDFVIRAAVAGIRVLPVLGNPPAFRALGYTQDDWWSPPSSNAEFAAFAAKLVQRYGPNGSVWAAHPEVAPLPIRSWQVWNEPNLRMFWNTGPDPAAYTSLLRAASDAIHAADPQSEVVAAGLPNSHQGIGLMEFVEGMFDAGAEGAFDTLAIHPYAADAAGSLALVEQIRALLTAHGDKSPIWITEVGWPTDGPLSAYTVSESQQAVNVRDLIAALGARRGALGVRGFVIFRWRDVVASFDAWPMHAGLVRQDGSLKPGLQAFREAVAALNPPAAPAQQPGLGAPGSKQPAAPADDPVVAPPVRVVIDGGELSRFGFLRVHMRCLERVCTGRLRADSTRRACTGRRQFTLRPGEDAVLRLRLKGTRGQVQRCKRILVRADTGPADPPAAAYLPRKPVRYER
jgi:hypothetical protein